jgi:hypothetical protein
MTLAGYEWNTAAENVFASARSVEHGHAGFEVDWGSGAGAVGGMQTPPGHRISIHSQDYREIGIGVVLGQNSKPPNFAVGPQLVSQEFGSRDDLTPFVTGVVYYDLNANQFYDLGEGVSGARVTAAGSSYFADSAASGGYSLPVPGNGSFDVQIALAGAPAHIQRVQVSNQSSVKLDHPMVYTAPVVSGSDTPARGQPNTYTFTPMPGATRYEWQQARRVPVGLVEGAENGLGAVTTEVSPGYEVVISAVRASGSFAFHLVHPVPRVTQILTLDRVFLPGAQAQLTFQSRLGWATTNQTARAQVSGDVGTSWSTIWEQRGTGGSGDLNFKLQSASLAPWSGKELRLRFLYASTGSSFVDVTPGVGLHIDDITLSAADELLDATVAEIPSGTSFSFTPPALADYALSVRPVVGQRPFPAGAPKRVTAQEGPPPTVNVRLTTLRLPAPGQLQVDFQLLSGNPAQLRLERASSPAGPWTVDAAAVIQPIPGDGMRRATTTTAAEPQVYYRIRTD